MRVSLSLDEIVTREKMEEILEMSPYDIAACVAMICETEMALRWDLEFRGNAYWVIRDGLKVRISPDDVVYSGTHYIVAGGEDLKHAMYVVPDGMRGVSPMSKSKPPPVLGLRPGVVYFDDYVNWGAVDTDLVRDIDTRFGKAHLESLDHVPGVLRTVSRETKGGE